MNYVKFLEELGAPDLPIAGGKGANLGAMVGAGFPVPPGFCVLTDAYRRFIAHNSLQERIKDLVGHVESLDLPDLERVSRLIRDGFDLGEVPGGILEEVGQAYRSLGNGRAGSMCPVAVRSSATLEDLPGLSFAGQQDTYLNIIGFDSLITSIVQCWASLWTARAIGYRRRNSIHDEDAALAVVVQAMVPSQLSGVLFTANPVTGKRTEFVIEATLGLGESLVSGIVEPDSYIYDPAEKRVRKRTIGSKSSSVRPSPQGGTLIQEERDAADAALDDKSVLKIGALAEQVAGFFGVPQDIEWAMTGDDLFLLQSRPITSLYPLPRGSQSGDSLRVWFSFGSWQGVLDPITPLGQDVFRALATEVGNRCGFTGDDYSFFNVAGERLYVDITPLVRSKFGRRVLPNILSSMEPALLAPMRTLFELPSLSVRKSVVGLRARMQTIRFLTPFVLNTARNLSSPVRGRERAKRIVDEAVLRLERDFERATSARTRLGVLRSMMGRTPVQLLSILIPLVVSGQVPLQILLRMASDVPGGEEAAMELTRALPHDVTAEMGLALAAVAAKVQEDAIALRRFKDLDETALASEYLSGRLPEVAQTSLDSFMQVYGVRGQCEIDLGRPRWIEDPANVMRMLRNYLDDEQASMSPESVFHRGMAKAASARDTLLHLLRSTKRGALKQRIARLLITRVRELGGMREYPKFAVMRLFGVLRRSLLILGMQLSKQGLLADPSDIFFLHLDELDTDASLLSRDWRELVEERKRLYTREKLRTSIPRMLLSDGTAFYGGMIDDVTDEGDVLRGSPVSAGVVEGTVRVVMSPLEARLNHGEILVCPATDPSWTPLFLSAGGLIMEVGGMMTHGSVVAREYGIPAVVGVHLATSRLKTGQRIRLDGHTGMIYIMDVK